MKENYKDLDKLRKELRMTRIFSGITSVLLICVLVGGLLVFSRLKRSLEDSIPLVEKMSAQLEALDVDALNESIAGLNTEELTEALEHFNDAVDTMESFTGSVKDFFSKFGGVLYR